MVRGIGESSRNRKTIFRPSFHGMGLSIIGFRARVPSRALSFRPVAHRPWLSFRGNDQSVNITRVGITGNGDGSYDYSLTGLRKYTQYSIVVKAFNNKGDGPGSDPVAVQTLEDGESTPPNDPSSYCTRHCPRQLSRNPTTNVHRRYGTSTEEQLPNDRRRKIEPRTVL